MKGLAKQFATQQHLQHNTICRTQELCMKGREKQFAAQQHLLHNKICDTTTSAAHCAELYFLQRFCGVELSPLRVLQMCFANMSWD